MMLLWAENYLSYPPPLCSSLVLLHRLRGSVLHQCITHPSSPMHQSCFLHASVMLPSCISHSVMHQSCLRHSSVMPPSYISHHAVIHRSCLRHASVIPPLCISHASVMHQSSIRSDLILCSACAQLSDLHKCNLVAY